MNKVGYCLSLLWNGVLFLALNDDFGEIPIIKENISTSLAVSCEFLQDKPNVKFSTLALESFLESGYGQLLRLYGLVVMLKMDSSKHSNFNQSLSFLVYGHNQVNIRQKFNPNYISIVQKSRRKNSQKWTTFIRISIWLLK